MMMLQIRSAFLVLAILASSALAVEDERESVYSIVRKGRSVEQEEVARVLKPKSTKAPTFPPTKAPTRAPSPPTPAPTRAPTVPTAAPTKKSPKAPKSTKAPTTPPTNAPTPVPTTTTP